MTGGDSGHIRPGRPIPGNRWNELAGLQPDPLPTVTVVLPYYDQQEQLDLVLDALGRQNYPASLVEIIVADDGSPERPVLPLDVGYVRQDDRGFRAGAARNLGATESRSEILAFLDADTVPEVNYLRFAVRLPALAPEAVVVGRRRYAKMTGQDANPSIALTEPEWLHDGYADTRDLLDADDHSYRYVISAVLTCSRSFFEETGGFDPTLVGYGGEDWDFAHRAWQCGALLAYESNAVAWHDGPAFDERALRDSSTARDVKNREALALAERISLPGARPAGVIYAKPDLEVQIAAGGSTDSVVATVIAILQSCDARVLLPGDPPRFLQGDPRVRRNDDNAISTPAPGRAKVFLQAGVVPNLGSWEQVIKRMHRLGMWRADLTTGGVVVGHLTTMRGIARSQRWGRRMRDKVGLLELDCQIIKDVDLEATFGEWSQSAVRFPEI